MKKSLLPLRRNQLPPMDPIRVLQKERDKIHVDIRRLEVELEKLDKAIEVLSALNGSNTNEVNTDADGGPPFDLTAYGEWRKIVRYILKNAGRFISWRQLLEHVRLLDLEGVDPKQLVLSVRNALYGLREQGSVVTYKMLPPNPAVWGLIEYFDEITNQPKIGHGPKL